MTYKNVKLGELIERTIQPKYHNLTVDVVRGVSIQKVIIPTKANMSGVNIDNYNVVNKGEFVYATNTARMGDKIAVAFNDGGSVLVSKIYIVFRIINQGVLDPIFLYLYFAREDFDRYARYNSWGSVRETFDWSDMCNIKIPLPPIEKQREYVAIYGNLLKLTSNHEKSFADLQLISDTYIEQLANKYGTEELGQHIQSTDTRNRDLAVKKVQGISIRKVFIDSKANMDGVPLGGYKVVRPGKFAYVPVTSRNGQKISIAINDSEESYIVSSTYTTFEIIDTSKFLPEFLLLWFKRSEFDRYARYNSWGSARETFDWDEMKRVRVPVPPVEVQRSIVAIYHALESRKKLTERLKNIIKDISPVLIKDAKDHVMENQYELR